MAVHFCAAGLAVFKMYDFIGHRGPVSYTHLDVYKRQKLLSLDEREERQRLELFGVAFLLAERQKGCIIEGPQLYQICLLYTSRCV